MVTVHGNCNRKKFKTRTWERKVKKGHTEELIPGLGCDR